MTEDNRKSIFSLFFMGDHKAVTKYENMLKVVLYSKLYFCGNIEETFFILYDLMLIKRLLEKP